MCVHITNQPSISIVLLYYLLVSFVYLFLSFVVADFVDGHKHLNSGGLNTQTFNSVGLNTQTNKFWRVKYTNI